jgi:hypothetical protein
MKALLLIGLLLIGNLFSQTAQQPEAEDTYQKAYVSAVDRMESKYPELQDEGSKLSILLDHRIAVAQINKDPALADPRFIEKFADEIAGELATIANIKKLAAEQEVPATATPTTAPAPAVTPRGANPEASLPIARLQTLARSGYVWAQYEMDRRNAQERVTASVNVGTMTQEAAATERVAIDQRFEQQLQNLQLEDLIEEQKRLKWSLQRLQQEQDRRRRHNR